MRQHYEHLLTKKLSHLDEGDKFLEKCKFIKSYSRGKIF